MDPQNPGVDPQANAAAYDPTAAEMHEGAPAFSDAPDGQDAPEQEPEEQVDYRALYEQSQQETAQERQLREAREAELQRLAFQASQYAWQQEVEEHKKRTANLDYEEARKADESFYRNREQQVMNWAQQATAATYINAHAEKVIAYWGLNPEDRAMLGGDPNRMNDIAQSIATQRQQYRSELQETKKELKQLRNQIAANAALQNPAYRQGGGRPPVATPPNVDKGSIDHLGFLLGIPTGRQQPGRRQA